MRIVGDIGLEADLDGLARHLHRESVERQIEPKTPGLQIGFLQRPVVEKALGRGGLRQPANVSTSSGAKKRSAVDSGATRRDTVSTSTPTVSCPETTQATQPSAWDRLKCSAVEVVGDATNGRP